MEGDRGWVSSRSQMIHLGSVGGRVYWWHEKHGGRAWGAESALDSWRGSSRHLQPPSRSLLSLPVQVWSCD